jgi:general L-amino acid transport system permease protein
MAGQAAAAWRRALAQGPGWWSAQLAVTAVSVWLLWRVGSAVVPWTLTEARWDAVTRNFRLFAVGRYPGGESWRVALALGIVLAAAVVTAVGWRRRPGSRWRRLIAWVWLLSLPLVLLVLHGAAGLAIVPAEAWGGLLLTLVLASVAIAVSLPLGVLLALGRRSSLPLVHVVCVLYIELIRGVPLVTVLYMAAIVVPLLLPQGLRPDNVFRAAAGLALFNAAYIAEDVRGGLANVGRGQTEAARALGLGTATMYRIVILPQALRTVVPSLVGQFISLFKDTSLVIIIGLRELLGIARAVVNQPEFLGLYRETLLFVALVDFVFCFSLSRASRRLEQPGHWEQR